MKYTNQLNLPQAIVDAVVNDKYDKGESDISITGLLSPPRIRVLKKKHEAELTEDISDYIYMLLGQTMHTILERANKNALAEKRFFLDIDGIVVSGALDAFYEHGLIQDYKLVSMYQVRDGVKLEYEQQLNLYAYLIKHGYYWETPVDQGGIPEIPKYKKYPKYDTTSLELVCILRDWSKGKVKFDPDLPQQQVVKQNVILWPEEKQLAFLLQRIKIHKQANKQLPECTNDERWGTPDKWAVMPKKGAARSLKNHDTKEMADQHSANVPGSFVEYRPGENKRCSDWCSVSQFCEQYKKLRGEE